ncbi:peptidase C15 pyroglutamyl peptidase I-like protein [Dacryopinax primogenitus]|uniref:Peptidase C15 pyroglutamyl peptidase I-like protein n=1 Tax=Dacryopinax primogenitus (strain DJM 731) TaxID=1858805 RepID=M5GDJ3_DACPD|nr:peptidase C15 pyroglutamyl peptidase I-like protein [Dacryopinax primogenitus]EJU02453.1 peptidase C15 pyroglutamyl peptidase I-like protein [Dacryopinax primogenitus]
MAPTEKKPFNVLVTGFGPFRSYAHNPSWLGVFPLHNTTHPTPSHTIHFICFRVPTSYATILALILPLYARPPQLPESQYPPTPGGTKAPYEPGDPVPQALPPPPEGGYDLVIHVGAGHAGHLALESQAHKTGYRIEDWEGQLPPVVSDFLPESAPTAAERGEMARLGLGGLFAQEGKGKRGFGTGYEQFPELLPAEGDVPSLVEYLKSCGLEHTLHSTDAGHYCCDFIYYCSLAESQRLGVGKGSKVQFMHIPPPGEPYESEQVSEAIRRIAEFYAGV